MLPFIAPIIAVFTVSSSPHSSRAPTTPAPTSQAFDVVILGGGVAGLWILNRLLAEGYNAILLEQEALGAGQTIASQGMIHGGVKYTLTGALSGASEAIADMPDYWRSCLAGTGSIDLRQTRVLSDRFYMWSTANTLSKITSFLASKALRGRVEALPEAEFPPLFQHPSFRGNLYQLIDSVMDTRSLLENLASNAKGRIFHCPQGSMKWNSSPQGFTLTLMNTAQPLTLEAGQFIFAAGKGNAALLQDIGAIKPEMQIRPLHQVMVKHSHDYSLYAHCVGVESTPRLTISSHRCPDGQMCWYLGGQLAEQGVEKNPAALIQEAKHELAALVSWLDWRQAQWATYRIDRAEPRQKNFVRPDHAFMERATTADQNSSLTNVLVAWPTKLTLAPHLGDEALAWMRKLALAPQRYSSDPESFQLAAPAIAPAPWETAEWQA